MVSVFILSVNISLHMCVCVLHVFIITIRQHCTVHSEAPLAGQNKLTITIKSYSLAKVKLLFLIYWSCWSSFTNLETIQMKLNYKRYYVIMLSVHKDLTL